MSETFLRQNWQNLITYCVWDGVRHKWGQQEEELGMMLRFLPQATVQRHCLVISQNKKDRSKNTGGQSLREEQEMNLI